MKKAISIMLLLGLISTLIPGVAFTQEAVTCEQDVVVQVDDSLSTLANKFFGDVLAYSAIAQATNAKAAIDSSYATINNVNVIEVGWKLCVPSAGYAESVLNQTTGSSAPTGVSEAASAAPVAPDVDRVGFPASYQENFTVFYEFDRVENKTARVIYANEAAALAQSGQPYPYGSILVMEVYRTQQDDAGNVLLDENGRFQRGELSGLFVMRKEPGFGVKYGDQRNGEWEYAAYRPDGSVLTPPERTQACAACHIEASQAKDWVFRADRHFKGEVTTTLPTPGENGVIIFDYQFLPNNLTIKIGTEVTWTNKDVLINTATASDLSFNTRAIRPGASATHTFETPGTFEYISALHPNMKGTITVVE